MGGNVASQDFCDGDKGKIAVSAGKKPSQGFDMKCIISKPGIASGCVALALAAGLATAATADENISRHQVAEFENIFLGEIAATNYAEASNAYGVIGEVELVRERYPDGKIKVERQVTLNGDGNYVNHGAWKQYSTAGDVVAEGQYHFGKRVGLWTRWVGRNDAELIGEQPFRQFKAPFMSQVNFANDKMDGEWIVIDASERKVMVVALKSGERNGTTTIWLPNGKVYWQMTYDYSVPAGDLFEVNTKTGDATKTATFDQGRKVYTKTEHHPRGRQVKSEVMYLSAPSVAKSMDNYWSMKLAQYSAEGDDMRHGPMKTWFANGQQEQEGLYTNDKKTGTFKFWHKNGQLQSMGEYRDNKAEGTWVWWHDNGQKSAVGKYEHGTLVGDWRWWNEQGKLTKQQSYNGTESAATEREHVDVSRRSTRGSRN
jgi:antitoxin component YwqK of YwqJK toxin-antitoxin module